MRRLPMRLHRYLALALLASPLQAFCQDSSDTPATVPVLDTVVVNGTVAGPGMWRVDHGENTLWILGTVSPAPEHIVWDDADTRAILADAGAVLWPARFSVAVEGHFLSKASLAASAFGARKNPDGRTLDQVLDPQVHARWRHLRERYLPRDSGLEQKRPLIVAGELYQAALRKHALKARNPAASTVEKAVKEQQITAITPRHTLTISTAQARALIKDTRRADLQDQACLIATMDLLERGIPQLITNANAWATGEIDRIDTTGSTTRQQHCMDAFGDSDVLAQHGIPDIPRTLDALWLAEAEKSLQSRRSTLAVVSIGALDGPKGYLQALTKRGYTIQSP